MGGIKSVRGSRVVVIRELDENSKREREKVEEVERMCEVGGSDNKLSLFTHLLGDPICRVRHSPPFLMLVAEIEHDIVGMIRGCIKTVTTTTKPLPLFSKIAYILGLRVSPSHRRMGIASKLVHAMEAWFKENDAEYSYIATESDNSPSLHLFTHKCGYSKFRTPSILVNPVFAHPLPLLRRHVTILRLTPSDAATLYRRRFSATTEFFPRDIHSILTNNLSLGTFLAVPRASSYGGESPHSFPGSDSFLSDPPESWAVISVWNCKDVFNLQVRGASRVKKTLAKTTRVLDRLLPFLRLPSIPDFFRPFGFHFMYGLGGEGSEVLRMVRALCGHAHNIAMARGCGAVVTEVSSREPLRLGVPHWKRLSCAEDLWCIKRLTEDQHHRHGDWTKSPPGLSIFVDPREF